MTSLSVAVKIWAKTVFLFGVVIGFAAVLEGDLFEMFLVALAFIIGFIITIPLLLPIFSLVDLSKRLVHYGIPARIAWLIFYLDLMLFLIYELASQIGDNRFVEFNGFFCQAILVTTTILLVAVLSTRRSLNKLYTAP
jgi:hypothetical protein